MFSFVFLLMVLFFDNLILKNIFIFLFGISISGLFPIALSLGIGKGQKSINYSSGFLSASPYIGVIILQYLNGYFLEFHSANSILYVNLILIFIFLSIIILINIPLKFLNKSLVK